MKMNSTMQVIPLGNELGEGILWNDLEERFYWTDIQGSKLWNCKPDGGELNFLSLPARLASFALTDHPGKILAAFDRGLAVLSVVDGLVEWLCKPDLPSGVRFNDGRVDRSGRFIVGTMVEDQIAAGGDNLGCLYRFEADGSLRELLSGIAISNGLCFSPDGNWLYHADTPTRRLLAYSYEAEIPNSPRLVREFKEGEGPDGACVDSEGNIWIAIWGGGRVECLTPYGETLRVIKVDAMQPTCPAFGGSDLSKLAITSAWEGLAASRASRPERAGDVFLVNSGVRGIAEPRVALG